jgi:AcrR family transcriptional regulator
MTAANPAARRAGPPARRTRLPAAERRETILRAAAEVFAAAGYRAAKVSDVAAQVGVTEPVIFQNFGSKAALFAAVVERAAGEARAVLDTGAATPGTAIGLLGHILTGTPHPPASPGHPAGSRSAHAKPASTGQAGTGPAAFSAVHTAAARSVLFADAAALSGEPGVTGPARDAVRAVAGHLADLVRRAQADGDVPAGTDPEAAAWLLLSVLAAHRLRAAAMPAGLEPAIAGLTLRALTLTEAGDVTPRQ